MGQYKNRYEISDEEWERIKGMLPQEKTGARGRPSKPNRLMLNGILWMAKVEQPGMICLRDMDHGKQCIQSLKHGQILGFFKQYLTR